MKCVYLSPQGSIPQSLNRDLKYPDPLVSLVVWEAQNKVSIDDEYYMPLPAFCRNLHSEGSSPA